MCSSKNIFHGSIISGSYERRSLCQIHFVKKNDEAVANIILPSSEEVKNLSVKVKKYKKGCIFECFYGGGDNFYSRCFYFKCANGKLVLYQVVGTHSVVDSDKIITEKKDIRPHINIKDFNILNYLENSP